MVWLIFYRPKFMVENYGKVDKLTIETIIMVDEDDKDDNYG